MWFLGIGITLVDMASRKRKKRPSKAEEDRRNELVDKLAELLRREVDEALGPDATYEQRRDLEAELMRKILWKREDDDLHESATSADVVEIADKHYRRLLQASSATYHGRWGAHTIEEPLYREVGVRNGPTIKPLELRVGIIAKRLTPDLARIAGELNADENSRQLTRILTVVGMRPPSRAVLRSGARLQRRLQRLPVGSRNRSQGGHNRDDRGRRLQRRQWTIRPQDRVLSCRPRSACLAGSAVLAVVRESDRGIRFRG